ncbi:hypothetical protein SAMN05216284_112191 [Micromonospora sediminimaris]|nr:hypothetical protein SAMN05216284_112191 [Micromonospora sediminimaris]
MAPAYPGFEVEVGALNADPTPNAEHYTSDTVTERREHPGYAHLPPAQQGWERIADEVLDWTVRQAA